MRLFTFLILLLCALSSRARGSSWPSTDEEEGRTPPSPSRTTLSSYSAPPPPPPSPQGKPFDEIKPGTVSTVLRRPRAYRRYAHRSAYCANIDAYFVYGGTRGETDSANNAVYISDLEAYSFRSKAWSYPERSDGEGESVLPYVTALEVRLACARARAPPSVTTPQTVDDSSSPSKCKLLMLGTPIHHDELRGDLTPYLATVEWGEAGYNVTWKVKGVLRPGSPQPQQKRDIAVARVRHDVYVFGGWVKLGTYSRVLWKMSFDTRNDTAAWSKVVTPSRQDYPPPTRHGEMVHVEHQGELACGGAHGRLTGPQASPCWCW